MAGEATDYGPRSNHVDWDRGAFGAWSLQALRERARDGAIGDHLSASAAISAVRRPSENPMPASHLVGPNPSSESAESGRPNPSGETAVPGCSPGSSHPAESVPFNFPFLRDEKRSGRLYSMPVTRRRMYGNWPVS